MNIETKVNDNDQCTFNIQGIKNCPGGLGFDNARGHGASDWMDCGARRVSDFKGEIPLNISEKGGSVHWKGGIQYKCYITLCQIRGICPHSFQNLRDNLIIWGDYQVPILYTAKYWLDQYKSCDKSCVFVFKTSELKYLSTEVIELQLDVH